MLLFAAQNIFSTILRLASLEMQNSPFRLRHCICGRSASPRIVTEKILIRAQSNTFQFFSDLLMIIRVVIPAKAGIQLKKLDSGSSPVGIDSYRE